MIWSTKRLGRGKGYINLMKLHRSGEAAGHGVRTHGERKEVE